MNIYPLLRTLLFSLPTETSHHISLNVLALAEHLKLLATFVKPPPLAQAESVTVMGLNFPNRVGLAAGLDKNADFYQALARFGFGFIETGTVTPKSQLGNTKPRLFRLKQHQGMINRLGFNNRGVEHLINNIKNRAHQSHYKGVLGVNIGKNFNTPLTEANADYTQGLTRVYPYADYICVNISSPNTQGLRALQHGKAFEQLLQALHTQRLQLQEQWQKNVPIAVKLSPDMSKDECKRSLDILLASSMDAIVATNTTMSRPAELASYSTAKQLGGLSGSPLLPLANEQLRHIRQHIGQALPIIGVGGICSGIDALEKLRAGADLIQIYTGFIYQGPQLIKDVLQAIATKTSS